MSPGRSSFLWLSVSCNMPFWEAGAIEFVKPGLFKHVLFVSWAKLKELNE